MRIRNSGSILFLSIIWITLILLIGSRVYDSAIKFNGKIDEMGKEQKHLQELLNGNP